MRTAPFIFILACYYSSASVYAESGEKMNFEQCLSAAKATRPGIVIKVEMKEQSGLAIYEFDIRDNDNRDWDIECRADTAEIVELEEEVFATNHPKFVERMKIDFNKAKAMALQEYPGEILEIEFEIEADGLPVYEFDIRHDNGEVIKVEIDASTGVVHEVSRELWQIGYE